MKVELVQTACPAATGNYDIVSGGGASSPNNDMIGALFFSAQTTTDDTNIASTRWSFGATDLVNNICVGVSGQDATAGAQIRAILSNTNCLMTPNPSSGLGSPVASFGSSLSNGIRLTTSAVTTGRLHNTLLISGSDCAMKVGQAYIASGGTSAVITHGLGGTPDVIIILTAMEVASNTSEISALGYALGFYENAGVTQASWTYRAETTANPTDEKCRVAGAGFINAVAQPMNSSGSVLCNTRIDTVGSTQFTINQGVSSGTNNMYGWIALRGTSQAMFSKTDIATMPTGTGNTALISGMSGKPQVFLALPTRLPSPAQGATDDTAGCFGSFMGCTTDFATTFQGGNVATFQDNVATSVGKHRISIAKGLVNLLNTGAPDAQATVNSWDSGGVTLNYSVGASGSYFVPVLAFGLPPPSSGGGGAAFMMLGV